MYLAETTKKQPSSSYFHRKIKFRLHTGLYGCTCILKVSQKMENPVVFFSANYFFSEVHYLYTRYHSSRKKWSQKSHWAHLNKDFNLRQCSNNKNSQTAASPHSHQAHALLKTWGVPEHKPHKQLSLMPRKRGAEPWKVPRTSLLRAAPPWSTIPTGSHMQAWEQSTPLLPQPQTCTGRSPLPPGWAPPSVQDQRKSRLVPGASSQAQG